MQCARVAEAQRAPSSEHANQRTALRRLVRQLYRLASRNDCAGAESTAAAILDLRMI